MTTSAEIIELIREQRDPIRRMGVKEIGVFGSFARGEQRPDSDVDILVEMEGRTFDSYMNLLFFLEDLFGRQVDLVDKDTIKPLLRNRVLRDAVYVADL